MLRRGSRGLIAWLSAALAACGAGAGKPDPQPEARAQTAAEQAEHADLIRVREPRPNAVIRSPLLVTGEARGTWYFEADFPVVLLDASGRPLARTYAQAQGEWMTEEFVPFRSELTFETPTTDEGTLLLEKANPSGLPEHAAELRIPVRFARP